jgi:hypothetical protein
MTSLLRHLGSRLMDDNAMIWWGWTMAALCFVLGFGLAFGPGSPWWVVFNFASSVWLTFTTTRLSTAVRYQKILNAALFLENPGDEWTLRVKREPTP